MANNQGPPTRHNNLAPTFDTHCHNYSTFVSWEEYDSDDYGDIGDRGKEILIERPADSIEQLAEEKHIEVQLFLYNREQRDKYEDQPNDGTVLFDGAVLSLMDQFLEIVNFDREKCTVPEKYLKIRFLLECRALKSPDDLEQFRNYLAGKGSDTQDILDIADPYDDVATFKMTKKVSDELSPTEQEQLLRASTRTVYGALREGVEPPEETLDAHNIKIEDVEEEAPNIESADERRALCNWIEYLIDNTIGPLTLHRKKENIDWDMVDLLGLLATSAYIDRGLETAAKFSEWMYDEENVPQGGSFRENVPDMEALVDLEQDFATGPNYIEDQFADVFDNMLELARKHNFFEKPVDIAVDTTDILWDSPEFKDMPPEERPTVKIRPKRDIDTTRAWRFTVGAIIDTESRFTLGVRLIKNNSFYPTAVDDIVPEDSPHFDVNAIFADAGDVSGNLIKKFRSRVDTEWVTKCRKRKKGDIKNLIRITPCDRSGYVEGVPWNCKPKPNVVAYPQPYYQEEQRDKYDDEEEVTIPKTPIKFPYRLLEQDDVAGIVEAAPHRQVTVSGDYAEVSDDDPSPPPDTPEDLVPTDTDMDAIDDERDLLIYPEDTGSFRSEPRTDNESTHEVYLTDRTLPDRSVGGIFYKYHQRWAVEVTNNQIKNDFRPFTQSKYPEMQIYFMNIAALFQNWHTMINRAPSPQLGIRLDVTAEEVLKAIQEYAFSEDGCAEEANWRPVR